MKVIEDSLELSEKDTVFGIQDRKTQDFKFNDKVANVFDDMVTRSVPVYQEIQKIV